jgi:hypothetical protein
VAAAARARKRVTSRGCPRKSFRKRAHIGCFAPADLAIAGEEMLVVAARKLARRNY